MTPTVRWMMSGVLCFALGACGGRGMPGGHESTAETPRAEAKTPEKTNSVQLAADVQTRLGIVVESVRSSQMAGTLRVAGTVQPDESRVSHVRPLGRARVQTVRVNVGERVARGATLAELDDIEAGQLAADAETARAELARLQAHLATATSQAARSAKLLEIGAVPRKEYEADLGEQRQLEASVQAQQSTLAGLEARLRRHGWRESRSDRAPAMALVAPLTGIVTAVAAAPGDVVDSSNELFTIADLSRVYVRAQVFEQDLGRVHVGQQASIVADAYPDRQFAASVASIGGVIDPQTRTADVRCAAANPDGLLKIGMFTTVELVMDATRAVLAVPADAVQDVNSRPVVFVQTTPGRFDVRPVTVGQRFGDAVEIRAGLRAGEAVAVRGAFQIKSALLAGALGEQE